MSAQPNPSVMKPFWRRALAGILDFLTTFFVGGYLISQLAGETSTQKLEGSPGVYRIGFHLGGLPALALLAIIVLYFYLGWTKFGGTIWQRILKAR